MARDINIAAQERFAEGINSGNFDLVEEVVAPDVDDHDPAPEQGPGPEGFKDMFRTMRTAFPDLEVTPEHMVATEDDVALAYTVTGTHQGGSWAWPRQGVRSLPGGSRSGVSRTDVSLSAGAPPTSSPSCSSSVRSRSRAGRRGRRS
jgi:predicted ester cyclase